MDKESFVLGHGAMKGLSLGVLVEMGGIQIAAVCRNPSSASMRGSLLIACWVRGQKLLSLQAGFLLRRSAVSPRRNSALVRTRGALQLRDSDWKCSTCIFSSFSFLLIA